MDLSLLEHLYQKKYYSIRDGFDNWEDAIRASVQPLIDAGAVKASYAENIIKNIKKFGPYIVIAPHVCIPHADDTESVNETTLCFMKSNKAVFFGEDVDQAELFFVLASNDPKQHIKNIRKLVEFIDSEELINALLTVKTEDDFRTLLDRERRIAD